MTEPTTAELRDLAQRACDVRRRAYAVYSGYAVGACLLTSSGEMFVGANVENASLGLTMCAERVAVGCAVSAGQQQFRALALSSPGGLPPCGGCRQVLAEFHPELPIILLDSHHPEQWERISLATLLPHYFRLPSHGSLPHVAHEAVHKDPGHGPGARSATDPPHPCG